jgi:hypothetical protein
MEVHTPEGPILSFKHFIVQLLMVVVGILIALGIDQFKDHVRHNHLADQVRTNLHAEIVRNRQRLSGNLDNENKLRAVLQQLVANQQQVIRDPEEARKRILEVEPSFGVLESTAWDTVLATQAIGYMDYSEVDAYGSLYEGQRLFNDQENRFANVWLALATYGSNTQELDRREIMARLAITALRHSSIRLRAG